MPIYNVFCVLSQVSGTVNLLIYWKKLMMLVAWACWVGKLCAVSLKVSLTWYIWLPSFARRSKTTFCQHLDTVNALQKKSSSAFQAALFARALFSWGYPGCCWWWHFSGSPANVSYLALIAHRHNQLITTFFLIHGNALRCTVWHLGEAAIHYCVGTTVGALTAERSIHH